MNYYFYNYHFLLVNLSRIWLVNTGHFRILTFQQTIYLIILQMSDLMIVDLMMTKLNLDQKLNVHLRLSEKEMLLRHY